MSKLSRRRGTCAFCGVHGALTREDATPRWLGRLINQHFPPTGRWEAVEIRLGEDQPYSERSHIVGGASSHKPVVVCPGCNNRWMSGLEQAVRSVLRPLVLGQPVHLTIDDMAVLAAWATKTALVYEFVQPAAEGTTASADDRHWFAAHRAPLPHSGVWLSRYVGNRGPVFIRRNTLFLYNLDDEVPAPEPHGLVTALVYGQAALRIAVVRSRPTYPTNFAVLRGPQTVQLHPAETEIEWPPAAVIDDNTLDAFTAMHR